MNNNVFAEWLQRQGYFVYRTQSSFWYNQGVGALQAFPYHRIIQPTHQELSDLLKKSNALILRYSAPIDSHKGYISYHVVFEGKSFSINEFPKKVRHDIQHGLDYCEYEPISLSRLENDGWKLREETLIRQGRKGAETKKWWSSLCRGAEGLEGFTAWGAIKDNELVASIFTYSDNDFASILYQQSATSHLKYGINNTLTFSYTNTILNHNPNQKIFYGLHSLDAPASVDEFKIRMGYNALPVRQRIVFNPKVKFLANNYSFNIIKNINKLFSGNSKILKLEGVIRFYLQGKLPLEFQEWPKALLSQKEQILASLNNN